MGALGRAGRKRGRTSPRKAPKKSANPTSRAINTARAFMHLFRVRMVAIGEGAGAGLHASPIAAHSSCVIQFGVVMQILTADLKRWLRRSRPRVDLVSSLSFNISECAS